MRNRTITVGVLAVVLVLALWWMLIYKSVKAQSADVGQQVQVAQDDSERLKQEHDELATLEARAPEVEAELQSFRAKVPQYADLASFIDQAEMIGAETGVEWVSVQPAQPTTTGTIGTIQVSIQVEGGYENVRNYLKRIEELPRLVIVDAVKMDKGSSDVAAEGETPVSVDPLGPPTLTATLTARMFTQDTGAVAVATPVAPETLVTTPPTAAPAAPEVQGGGGVAATPVTEN